MVKTFRLFTLVLERLVRKVLEEPITCYHFGPDGLSVAEKTIENFLTRADRIFERKQGEPDGAPSARTVCETVAGLGDGWAGWVVIRVETPCTFPTIYWP
jgi:hypothetical protein